MKPPPRGAQGGSPDGTPSPTPTVSLLLSPRATGVPAALVVGAFGIVFGDIGTSPLYTMRTVLTGHGARQVGQAEVFGIVSMIVWCLIIIVSVTYVGIILRADNDGEGGILSLASLIRRSVDRHSRVARLALLGAACGAALFIGDSLITPAISVLSAVEGLEVVGPELDAWVVPIAAIVLAILFVVQRRGTGRIGQAFGPVMVVWFLVIAIIGLPWIVRDPEILMALSPSFAIGYAFAHPWAAFIALGASVLAITGAEALYADLGHFGRRPILIAWFSLAFPALLINYLGQGSMLLSNPDALSNPFFNLAPAWSRIPLVLLATAATVIASQAVISGTYSVIRQASRLSLLPRVKVIQTSLKQSGQIYLPTVNWMLFAGVLALVLVVGSSDRLAAAYGFAVTGTLLLEFTLFLVFARTVWKWSAPVIVLCIATIGALEALLFLANVPKIVSGGWIPLSVAIALLIVMLVWHRGSKITFGRRHELEGPLETFLSGLSALTIRRVPGVAIYPQRDPTTAPLALRNLVALTSSLHDRVVIVTMKNTGAPHVPHHERITLTTFEDGPGRVHRIICRIGFNDSQDVPGAIRLALTLHPELGFREQDATYVLSVFRIEPGKSTTWRWPRWQRRMFRFLERQSANRTEGLHLPEDRTIVMGSEVTV